jgi:mitotic spindle assembly checkpoint protein MAD2
MAVRCSYLWKTFFTFNKVRSIRRPIGKGKSRVSPLFTNADESTNGNVPLQKEKTESEIHAEIQAIIRQITASVTFLPMLEGRCTFNVLVYADSDANVPDEEWGDSDAKEVKNAENVKLRSFSTMNHRIDTMVSYRLDAEEY